MHARSAKSTCGYTLIQRSVTPTERNYEEGNNRHLRLSEQVNV